MTQVLFVSQAVPSAPPLSYSRSMFNHKILVNALKSHMSWFGYYVRLCVASIERLCSFTERHWKRRNNLLNSPSELLEDDDIKEKSIVLCSGNHASYSSLHLLQLQREGTTQEKDHNPIGNTSGTVYSRVNRPASERREG